MNSCEVSKIDHLSLDPEIPLVKSLNLWRGIYRRSVFDSYTVSSSARELIETATDSMHHLIPTGTYQDSLKRELMSLHSENEKVFSKNIGLNYALIANKLSWQEFLKGASLTDLIAHGESLISNTLLSSVVDPTQAIDHFTHTLSDLGLREEKIQEFDIVGGVRLLADYPTSYQRGAAAVALISEANLSPEPTTLDRCIFVDSLSSGSAMIFRTQKTILAGTAVNINSEREEYELAERIKGLIHEFSHINQPAVSRVLQEYLSFEAESAGLTSLRTLEPHDIYPYSWPDLMEWISKIRTESDLSKSRILMTLADPDLTHKVEADHNIAALERQNNLQIKLLYSQA